MHVNHKKVYRYTGKRVVDSAEAKKTLGASGICAKCGDGSEPGVALDFVHDARRAGGSSAC